MVRAGKHRVFQTSDGERLFRLVGFALHRYTGDQSVPVSALTAWQLLGNSVYKQNTVGAFSLMLDRPGLNMGQSVRGETVRRFDQTSIEILDQFQSTIVDIGLDTPSQCHE